MNGREPTDDRIRRRAKCRPEKGPKGRLWQNSPHPQYEDNYDMSHFLQGAREREKKGEKLQPISQLPR